MARLRNALLLLALVALHSISALKLFGHDYHLGRSAPADERCTQARMFDLVLMRVCASHHHAQGPCDVTSRTQLAPRAVGEDSQYPLAAFEMSPWAQLRAFAPLMSQLEDAMRSSRAMAPALSVARTAVDVRETPDAFEFVADVPGIANKSAVQVVVADDNTLTISGERRFETTADVGDEPKAGSTEAPVHHRVERSYGRFIRSFQLPRNADGDKVTASVTAGVLTVRVPKKEVAEQTARGQIPVEWKDL